MGINEFAWRKSSRSSGQGNCVEVAALADGRVAVRDSKDPRGSVLVFGTDEWTSFLHAVHKGEFDG